MEELLKQQKRLRERFEKAYRNFTKDGPSRRTEIYFKKKLKGLDDDWEKFRKNEDEITNKTLSEAEYEHPYFKDDWFPEVEEIYLNTYSQINDEYLKIRPVADTRDEQSSNNLNQSQITHHNSEVKLPRISIPTFSGDYASWPSFFDLFSSLVHNKTSLSGAQKLQYLKAHLSGEALRLLSNTLVSDANYEPAWKLLIENYDNKRALLKTQLDMLLNQPKANRESAQSIKELKTRTHECLTAIENLEISTQNWDPILIHLLVQKLPSETHELWEQSQSAKSRRTIPTWPELRSFLETRFRTLEAVSNSPANKNEHHGSKPKDHPRRRAQLFHVTNHNTCILCKGTHIIRKCPKYIQMGIDERYKVVKSKELCINCLGTGHRTSQCSSKGRCFQCGRAHHTTLHRTQSASQGNNTISASPSLGSESQPSQTQTYFAHAAPHDGRQVLLATALITVTSPTGRQLVCRALIDPGSQSSFVRESVVQNLQLKKRSIQTTLTVIASMPAGEIKKWVTLQLKSRDQQSTTIQAQALVIKKISNPLPNKECSSKDWTHLKDLELADPAFHKPGPIDILLGADVFPTIILDGLKRSNKGSLVGQNTVFGWIITGKSTTTTQMNPNLEVFFTQVSPDTELKRFWELEELPAKSKWTIEETQCENHFANNVSRCSDGRYQVRLPFATSQNRTLLGASRQIAVRTLLQMEKRFEQNPALKTEYIKCMREYLTLGHMVATNISESALQTRDPNDSITYRCCYLPHHAVLKPSSTTTKLRVVFDASRPTTNGKSLNSVLLNGPVIQESLMSILMRWRRYHIAYMADIEKMYRQIRIHPDDSEFQRIVWRESPDQPIRDYQLKTVTFGTKSAPFLAIRTMHQLARDSASTYQIGSSAVLNDFYVDDLMTGADTIEEARDKQKQLIHLLRSGGLELRKWAANHSAILEEVPENDREISLPLAMNADEVKALGLLWNPTADTLSYKLSLDSVADRYTKRKILSEIAKLFDPIGWLTPVTINAKILIQSLWLTKLEWDEIVPTTIEQQWRNFRTTLQMIQTIQIPRWIRTHGKTKTIELHGFCDASIKAYAAATYIRTQNEDGTFDCHLIAAKSKVAPIKTVSLPKLELCGAYLLAKLMAQVKNDMKYQQITTHAWTDSTIVIAWLRKHPSSWETFVANRVSQIHQLLDQCSWNHVRTEENPADCATRGLTPSELKQHQSWWTGPKWLSQAKENWPKQREIQDTTVGQRKTTVNLHIAVEAPNHDLINRYSSLTRLLRVTAYCRRWLKVKSASHKKQPEYLTSKEIQTALTNWIKITQEQEFRDEIQALQSKQALSNKSKLLKLTPLLDQDRILRVGGRIQNANLTFSESHPIILPEKAPLSKLIISNVHHTTLHGGTQLMLNILRQKYWILNARNAVKYHNHRCIQCFRQTAAGRTQLMANLPTFRVRPARPFAHTGVDYCGPFDLKLAKTRNARSQKGYIALFICMVTKAIHLEVVTDASTENFLTAFRRFISRRGLCSDIYSDCGSNFVGAHNVLTYHKIQANKTLERELAEAVETQGINWHFIPPASPHFGGLWESGVKSVKYHLKRTIGNMRLTYEEFHTLTTQIEATLNSRPLTEMTQDPDDVSALTPGHFLIGGPLITPPEPSLLDTNTNRLNRYQLIQRLHQSFWTRWSTEYLHRLQQRPKWLKITPGIKINDLVLIRDERLPPSQWLLGRIIDIHPGQDGLIRVATVKTKNNVMKRPLSKLCILPKNTES